jgi:hypothetical protein
MLRVQGGEIIVRHNGQQTAMDLARLNLKKPCFAAFFAGRFGFICCFCYLVCKHQTACTAALPVGFGPLVEPSAQRPMPVAADADCEHEILPVTSGHRLTLVYNLCSSGASPAPPVVPTGVDFRMLVDTTLS